MEQADCHLVSTLLPITKAFLRESKAENCDYFLSMDDKFEADLGLGSLERLELFSQIETTLGVKLSPSEISTIQTLRDIVTILARSHGSQSLVVNQCDKATVQAVTIDPSKVTNLRDLLIMYTQRYPNRRHVVLLSGDGSEKEITYAMLYKQAGKISNALTTRGIQTGDHVALLLPSGEDFLYSFLGVIFSGAIPIPICPPESANQVGEYISQAVSILKKSDVRLLVTFGKFQKLAKFFRGFLPHLLGVTTTNDLLKSEFYLPKLKISSSQAAFVQYTYGSAGNFKKIVLTHKNILENIRSILKLFEVTTSDITVSWLPLHHDTDLIVMWLANLYFGSTLVLYSSKNFLSRPESWLWTIHKYRATISAGPNFAYEICINKINDNTLLGLDLSSWRIAGNISEMVCAQTLKRFSEKFSQYGFKSKALTNVYVLSEGAILMCAGSILEDQKIDRIASHEFHQKNIAKPIFEREKKYYEFVSCGSPIDNYQIRIVDEENTCLPERNIGMVHCKVRSMMCEYYRDQAVSEKVFHGGWIDTGDLGYLAEGELYITGRRKDIITKEGKNYYPTEIEDIITMYSDLNFGQVVVFSSVENLSGIKKILAIVESKNNDKNSHKILKKQICQIVVKCLGFSLDDILIVTENVLPKTTNGKLRRYVCGEIYSQKNIRKIKNNIIIKLFNIYVRCFIAKTKKILTLCLRFFYTIYLFLVLISMASLTYIAIRFFNRDNGEKIIKTASKITLRASFCSIEIDGINHIKSKKNMIFVSNHASYIDVLVLVAFLPGHFCYVAKSELKKSYFLRKILKTLEIVYVDRVDFSKTKFQLKQISKSI